MTDAIKLSAETRTEFGKGAARRTRREGKVPAVLYGHGTDPVHVALPAHETWQALKNANALLAIVVDGKEQLALAKDVQRDPIKPVIDHVDLVIVKRGEKVTVDVPVTTVGEAAAETVVTVENGTIQLEAEATRLPEGVEVSIEGLEAGTQILAKDLQLPAGTTLVADEELLVVNITAMISAEALEAELAEAEAEVGIEKEESAEESEETGATKDQAEGDAPAEEQQAEGGDES
ncbi:50S ribosomal protein L25/general stress protein Ctc [Arsenicicoccus dermatophilus]|uniref:50S ribosomal protein L25/general stress protein Ctc n=1 Tax=Arsenicicoccus dermatophilus TaxID=1076331 RepID=UPI001F4D225E|nr:50S ribosomal protein L25/general stress protein Ctc [Arsenicicoccus dermatophilus]MCH8612121.1 50S ribosomal protein L25/general stress protein Ctc [Arsenicicoccus dermatophilus]